MKKESGCITLNSSKIGIPNLSGNGENYMWTGFIPSEKISPFFIRDKENREYLIKLVKKLEEKIKEYRKANRIKSNIDDNEDFLKNKKNEIIQISDDIAGWIEFQQVLFNNIFDIDYDIYLLELCRYYEEILEKNPSEFNEMSIETKNELEKLRNHFNGREPFNKIEFIPEENKVINQLFCTRVQEKKYLKPRNKKILSELMDEFSKEKEFTYVEQRELLEEIFKNVDFAVFFDLFYYKENTYYEITAYLFNFLLEKGYSYEDVKKIKGDSLNRNVIRELEKSKDNVKGFYINMVKDITLNNIEYMDIKKLLIILKENIKDDSITNILDKYINIVGERDIDS